MKTTRYRFEKAIQEVKVDTTEWLKDEFRSILESDKDFTRKADYIGFSIASIDAKMLSLDEEVKELQTLKRSLKSAKDIVVKIGASVLSEYGIDRIEGAGISSITIAKEVSREVQKLEILDAEALIQYGYYTKVVDEDAVIRAYNTSHTRDKIGNYCRVTKEVLTTPAKLKINKRRSNSSSTEVTA